MNTKPLTLTLRRSFAISLAKGAFLLALIICGGGSYAIGGGFDMPEKGTDAQVMDSRPAVDGSPEALAERHGCWTGQAPADMEGVMPGHVITQHGYQGKKAVAAALAQIFDGADNGLTVHAFCR